MGRLIRNGDTVIGFWLVFLLEKGLFAALTSAQLLSSFLFPRDF